jgi:hypothetical protein
VRAVPLVPASLASRKVALQAARERDPGLREGEGVAMCAAAWHEIRSRRRNRRGGMEGPMNAGRMVGLGSAPNNRWQVSKDHADLTRAPVRPRPVSIAAEPQALTFDLARSAMIVIDMQNDFCAKGGWLDHIGVDVTPARAPIAPLNRLLARLRAHAVPVIWVNWGNRPDRLNLSPSLLHVYKPSGEGVGLGDPLPGSKAPVLEQGSWAAAIVDGLAVEQADIHVAKFRLSGFWDTPLGL